MQTEGKRIRLEMAAENDVQTMAYVSSGGEMRHRLRLVPFDVVQLRVLRLVELSIHERALDRDADRTTIDVVEPPFRLVLVA